MKTLALLCLVCAGCYDLDSLGNLYRSDSAPEQLDGMTVSDFAGNPSGDMPDSAAPQGDGAAPLDLGCPGGTDKCGGQCVDLQLDRSHCGDCNTACAMGMVCSGGRCGASCQPPLVLCQGACIDPRADAKNCGKCGTVCAPRANAAPACAGSACTVGVCNPGFGDCNQDPADGCEASLATDPASCGKCGAACPNVLHGKVGCSGGACTVGSCDPGFGDCDKSYGNGCEANFSTDSANCGACSKACAQGQVCGNGQCGMTCQQPLLLCQNACIDPRSDPANCSGCGQTCPMIAHGAPGCTGSVCGVGSCGAGFGDCDKNPANGCETNLLGDLANCGACGKACPKPNNADAACAGGLCGIGACQGGFGDCDKNSANGCETALLGDLANCGQCGVICPNVANGSRVCAGGACGIGGCNANFGNCDGSAQNGCEANFLVDASNCGKCGMVCPPVANGGPGCAAGACGVGACNNNFGDCDQKAFNGCEADLQSDAANCGKCGNPCQGSCVKGACLPWTTELSGTPVALQGAWGVNANEVYAVGGIGKIDHTTNGGVTWIVKMLAAQVMANEWLFGVWGSASNDVYVVGDSSILRSTDGGMNWLAQTSPVNESYHAVWGSGAGDVYIVGTTGTILHSVNSGATWTKQTSGTMENLLGVWGTPGGAEVWVVGTTGTILHTANAGANWTAQASPNARDLWSVWGTSAANVYAVGDAGTVIHSVGGMWSAQAANSNQLLTGIWGSGANDLYVTGWGGTILHSANGTNWAAEISGTNNILNAVWGSGPKDVYVVGSMGTILHHQ